MTDSEASRKPLRLGIYGGTFDPVHYGHLLLAENCREQCGLDEVWFVPAASPPHKRQRQLAPDQARVEMLELAVGGYEPFKISALEIERGGLSYTVDTLEAIRAERPGDELFLLLGGDSWHDLPDWREPQRICELARPVIVGRPHTPPLESSRTGQALAGIEPIVVTMPQIGLASSDLRERIAAGKSIRFRTPRAVEKYIETRGLYRDGATNGSF